MVSVKIGMDASGLTSAAGQAAARLDALSKAMEKAKEKARESGSASDWAKYSSLAVQHGGLSASAAGFGGKAAAFMADPNNFRTGPGGEIQLRLSERQIRVTEALIRQLESNGAKYERMLADPGHDAGEALALSSRIQRDQAELAAALGGGGRRRRGGQEAAGHGPMSGVWLNQIMSGINSGLGLWMAQLDRSGIIARKGAGDVAGGILAEKRLESNTIGGIGQMAAGLAGSLLPLALMVVPGVGKVKTGVKAVRTGRAARAARAVKGGSGAAKGGGGGGGIMNAFLGGSLISSLGDIFATFQQNRHNRLATEIASGELWRQQSERAMGLAAVLGDADNLREAFSVAAGAAARFGFSAEDGMDAMRGLAQAGAGAAEALAGAEGVFRMERATGADRGALMSLQRLSARVGGGDNALGAAWAGLQASGMSQGQFGEYLRAVQSAMENGISRGFAISAEDAAMSLASLSNMTGNRPLWQGEHGARRLAGMSAGQAAAAALDNSTHVMAFQAMRELYGGEEWWDTKSRLEKPVFNKGFFDRVMGNFHAAEGGKGGVLFRMKDLWGLDWRSAIELYEGWQRLRSGEISAGAFQTKFDTALESLPGGPQSLESRTLTMIQHIRNEMITKEGFRDFSDRLFPLISDRYKSAQYGSEGNIDKERRSMVRTSLHSVLDTGRFASRSEVDNLGLQNNARKFGDIMSLVDTALLSGNERQIELVDIFRELIQGLSAKEADYILQNGRTGMENVARATDMAQLVKFMEILAGHAQTQVQLLENRNNADIEVFVDRW